MRPACCRLGGPDFCSVGLVFNTVASGSNSTVSSKSGSPPDRLPLTPLLREAQTHNLGGLQLRPLGHNSTRSPHPSGPPTPLYFSGHTIGHLPHSVLKCPGHPWFGLAGRRSSPGGTPNSEDWCCGSRCPGTCHLQDLCPPHLETVESQVIVAPPFSTRGRSENCSASMCSVSGWRST